MNAIRLNQILTAVLLTIDETDGAAPESSLMLGLGDDSAHWPTVRTMLLRGGAILINESHGVTLTTKGRRIAAEARAFYANTQA